MDINRETASDLQLIRQSLDGDAISFELLFQRYRHSLHAYIFQKSGDELTTQEIIQETFVKAYFNLARFDPQYNFGQWTHTIARNLFIDHTRRRKSAYTVSIDQASHNINPPCDNLNPEEKIISEQRTRQLKALMEELPPHYRTMIELRFVKEYSYEEIAEKLDIPLGTVKTQIHRAREKLCALISAKKLI